MPDDATPSSEESDANVGAFALEKPVPDGGVRAWLVVLSAFSCNVCTFGYINSFGTYQTYYGKHMLSNETASNISWIGSLQILLLFFGGIASGPLADRHGVKAVVIPASFLMVFSVMMTSLSTEYYQFILSQGIAGGLASGMLFTPVVSTVGQYFSTKRAWAMGITVSGASVGGVIFPIALDRLLNNSNIGFGWSVRVIGFIMLVLLSFTSFVISEHAARRKGRLFIAEAFTSVPWVCLNIAFFATLLGMYTPIFYIVDYSLAHGESTRMAAYEVPILNAMSFFGRTLPGYAGDKVGRLNMDLFMTAGTAILIFCWVRTETNASITVFAALFGFFSGGVVSLYSPCIAETCPNRSDIGTYLGMGMAIASIAGLGGTPINGALIDRFGYSAASIFSGIMVLVGAGALLVARFHISRSLTAVV